MTNSNYTSLNNHIDLLLDAVCVVDKSGNLVFVNAGCERIFGYTQAEMIGKRMIDLVYPADKARTLQEAAKVISGQLRTGFENRYVRKDGSIVHIQWSARWSDSDELRVAVARDITQSKHADAMQAALYAISEAAHTVDDQRALFESIHDIIGNLIPTKNFVIAFCDLANGDVSFPYGLDQQNAAFFTSLFDRAALCNEVARRGHAVLLTPQTPVKNIPASIRAVIGASSLNSSLNWLGVPLKTSNRTLGIIMVQRFANDAAFTETDSELLQFVSVQIATAIERKQMLARLQYIALYDQLTDLPNRELFYDRVRGALARARREKVHLALLYIDLDGFKHVNDTHGHSVGDVLLQHTAQRILQCVRECDTVSRFGGDEFVVLLENIDIPESAAVIAEKIINTLNQPIDLPEQVLSILPSIGIAIYPDHGKDERELLHHADTAMYDAKKCGGNGFQLGMKA